MSAPAAAVDPRWSRGCGSGIGLSHHKHEFRLGVNIGNWTEDREAVLVGGSSVGGSGRFLGDTTQRTSYTPEGKYGAEALQASERQDLAVTAETTRDQDVLTRHGKFTEPAGTCYATLNQLTYGEKQLGEPRVATYLWWGTKFNDFNVPRDKLELGLTTRKTNEWKEHEEHDMYQTTSKLAQEKVLGQYTKRDIAQPQSEGGQPPSVGRKAGGEMVRSLEAPHRRTGLRGPIPKLVKE
mmetsp:Transcript_28464/g.80318  ORF Transcript_28464/g.80318 Transcript_28464/m.80318 type:complete len:238 (-) Transcript_28464:194-907(-)